MINIFFSITALLLPLGGVDLANQQVGSTSTSPPDSRLSVYAVRNCFLHLTAAQDSRPVELSPSSLQRSTYFIISTCSFDLLSLSLYSLSRFPSSMSLCTNAKIHFVFCLSPLPSCKVSHRHLYYSRVHLHCPLVVLHSYTAPSF